MAITLFGQAQLQSSAGYTAHSASSAWGRDGDVRQPLYSRMFDEYRGAKLGIASGIAEARLAGVTLPGYVSAHGDTGYSSDVFGRKLAVGLRGRASVPNRGVTKMFGLGGVFTVDYCAKSLMPDFAESIRCIRYVLEIEHKMEESSPQYAQVANSFTDFRDKIREFIGGLK